MIVSLQTIINQGWYKRNESYSNLTNVNLWYKLVNQIEMLAWQIESCCCRLTHELTKLKCCNVNTKQKPCIRNNAILLRRHIGYGGGGVDKLISAYGQKRVDEFSINSWTATSCQISEDRVLAQFGMSLRRIELGTPGPWLHQLNRMCRPVRWHTSCRCDCPFLS